MAIPRDWCCILISTGIGGYEVQYFRTTKSPADVAGQISTIINLNTTPLFVRVDNHNTKVQMKNSITRYIDERFDTLDPGEVVDNTNVDQLTTDP